MRVRRKLFRGLRRMLLRKLKNALNSIKAMDQREAISAAKRGDDGDFFNVGTSSAVDDAINALQDRITVCLTARTP